jgi:hypothetical protein
MAQLVLDLPPDVAARIAEEAAARGVTAEAVAAEAVEAWVMADDEDWEEDDRRMNEGGESIPLEEVFDRLEARIAAKHPGSK